MTRMKLASNSCFLIFGNIPPQNKDTEVASVRKICLIKLFLSILHLKSSESTVFGFYMEIQIVIANYYQETNL